MTQPAFPLICISSDSGIDLIPSELSFSKVSTLALTDRTYFDQVFLFDRDGKKWTYRQVSENFKNNWLTKTLAKTFYNPTLEVKVIWTFKETYALNELKDDLKDCVNKDDDIITQFVEADVIKSTIDDAKTFDDILDVLNKYVFAVNEAELWKQQEKRNK
jgi:hypothetical protein